MKNLVPIANRAIVHHVQLVTAHSPHVRGVTAQWVTVRLVQMATGPIPHDRVAIAP
jgi:hypothetical protein